jgi:Fe-S-cluster-containing dehydrogenase component/CRP-like cAMP-binding protein
VSTFSEVVWGAAVLRGLDARARSEIEAAGSLLELRPGERVYRPGEPADTFFIVQEGRVRIRATPRGEEELRVIREARRGEAFGEEATVQGGGTRPMEAECVERARLAVIPVPIYLRAMERSGGAQLAEARSRALRRATVRDLLRATSFARTLDDVDFDVLLDAGEHRLLARGEALYRQGDPAHHVFFVADGMVQLQTEDDGKKKVSAYVSRGDLLGDTELPRGEPRRMNAVAAGASWLLAVRREVFLEVAGRHRGLVDGIRRVTEHVAAPMGAGTTQHVFKDLYRLHVARSLLVIDQNACVRCGHCAWSCADAHGDGVSRLTRRGDKIDARVESKLPEAFAALLLPSSCQHCAHPACMMDCPTGAIGRDPGGEVFIREDLCTGCTACAKACPWDNIQMAPSSKSKEREIAVKCDLCSGRDGGPACVAACPTEAIARIEPEEVLVDVRRAAGKKEPASPMPAPSPMWPTLVGAALLGLAASILPLGKMTSGIAAGIGMLALGAYAVIKRSQRFRLRLHFVAHIALGLAVTGVVAAHAGVGLRTLDGLPGAALVAFVFVAVLGGFGAAVYRALPRRLTRLERAGQLPEDLRGRREELRERIFRELTGKDELVKALFRKFLQPYERAPWGPLFLTLSGRTLKEEEARLRRGIDQVLRGRGKERLDGIDGIVRTVVECRATGAQRLLTATLRGWLMLHVALSVVLLILMLVHGILAVTSVR